jgi:hypothetical protein
MRAPALTDQQAQFLREGVESLAGMLGEEVSSVWER